MMAESRPDIDVTYGDIDKGNEEDLISPRKGILGTNQKQGKM